jgi:hypothetical protein
MQYVRILHEQACMWCCSSSAREWKFFRRPFFSSSRDEGDNKMHPPPTHGDKLSEGTVRPEAVNRVTSWSDLRHRRPGRRLYVVPADGTKLLVFFLISTEIVKHHIEASQFHSASWLGSELKHESVFGKVSHSPFSRQLGAREPIGICKLALRRKGRRGRRLLERPLFTFYGKSSSRLWVTIETQPCFLEVGC